MFTGIIETTAEVLAAGRNRLVLRPKRPLEEVEPGESIAVDGVCLTVESVSSAELVFRLLPETIRVSTLGGLKKGKLVNLERSLRTGDRLGGHLLWGHVDGRGTVERRFEEGGAVTLEIRPPEKLACFLIPKGPIGVDGVSLTLGSRIEPGRFQVHLVRHTLAVTALGRKGRADTVNLEVDPIAKYLHRML